MRVRVVIAVVVVLAVAGAFKLGRNRASAPTEQIARHRLPDAAWDASRWAPAGRTINLRLLALDGRTTVGMLDRGANRPLILILAAPGSPALDRCASRWRELFEIYKDRVEFLTVFVAAPATDTRTVGTVRQRVDTAMTFTQCNNWRIPILVDGADGEAAAAYGAASQVAVLLDENRRQLGAPVALDVPGDLDGVNAWLRHRFVP